MKKIIGVVKDFFTDFKDFWFLLKPQFKYGGAYYTLSFILYEIGQVGNNILWVYFYKVILDMAVAGESFLSIMTVIALFLLGVVVVDLLRNSPLANFCPEWGAKINARISKNILIKALECDYKNFDDPEFYQNYTLTLTDYMGQSQKAFSYLQQIVANIITFFTMIVLVSSVSPVILVVTVAVLVATSLYGRLDNKYSEKKWEETSKINRRKSYIQRIIYLNTYAADLRSNRSGSYMMEQYDEAVEQDCSIRKRFKAIMLSFHLLDFSVPLFVDLAAMGAAIRKIASGALSVGSFSSTIKASEHLYNSFDPIIGIGNMINRYALYSRKLQSFFKAESTIESPKTPTGRELTPKTTDMPFAVEMKNVSFSYDNSNFALKNISMSIKPGQKIAIVGENGAGKSTLTKLLLRLYDTSSGDILINGQPIQDYDVHALRSDIGIAFQNTNLFAMTLAENMKLYREVSDEKLNEVVGKLGLSSVLKKFDCGLDAQVTKEFDKNGIVLSDGETQKLGLARLFTGQFGLLILDEPSAALDPIAEYELNKVIMELRDTTTIMISHRLSTVRDADCIYLIENGEIAEFGSHAELMKQDGKYAAMFNMQAEKYVSDTVSAC